MKLSWLTDIHLNFVAAATRKRFYQEIINTGCECVLISGDIAEAPIIKEILQELADFIERPIYFVLGNHDYYSGQVEAVRSTVTALTISEKYLFWLPASDPLRLDKNTLLVGQDGWADGRLGNYYESPVVLNDSLMIADLFQVKMLGRSQLLEKMQQLADHDATNLQENLMQAVMEHPKRIIILTHVPPFKEACMHEGRISNDNWLPYFASKISGDVLTSLCTAHPDIDFLVLCGHTHGMAKYCPLTNLTIEVGHAEYNKPKIQRIITTGQ
jgi:predicted MPP superfamily phosphohydrolase